MLKKTPGCSGLMPVQDIRPALSCSPGAFNDRIASTRFNGLLFTFILGEFHGPFM